MALAIVLTVGAARGAVRLGPGVGATGSTESAGRRPPQLQRHLAGAEYGVLELKRIRRRP